ncbi:MAG TPA: response regulator transcription factor [Rectinemataceae bacterium]|nr:response regulator transcription factor [Rectinemataceae bacterium]
MSRIRVLLVDDQALFVESLRTVLERSAEDIEVVGIARNGAQAVEAVAAAACDLVVMDVRMPVMDGVEATKRIRAIRPDARIMMLTTFEDDEYVKEALEHGAAGYILKDIAPAELIASIRVVAGGAFLIAPSVAKSLIRRAYLKPEFSPTPEPEWLRQLSRREREILGHLVEGRTNKEIAAELCIAEQTVRNHISVVYDKMGVPDRAQAVRLAREASTKM